MRKNKWAKITAEIRRLPHVPLLIMLVIVLTAVFGPLLAPHPPTMGNLYDKLLPPSFAGGKPDYFLGTDALGRDVLSRLIYGSRISLTISLIAIFLSGIVGTTAGLIAAYRGGWVESLIMRLVDITLSFPMLLIAILMAVVIGPSYGTVILVISLLLWPRYARQMRGEGLAIKAQDFVALARVAGCSPRRILWRHFLPNVLPTILVLATLEVGGLIILESSLSFLGVGIPPPAPAWGSMVADGRGLIASAWWISFFPGLAILLTCLSMNMTGDWARDRFDPRLRQV